MADDDGPAILDQPIPIDDDTPPRRRRRPRPVRVRPTVPSPCVSVCRFDERTGYCAGCWRSLEEIGDWIILDDAARRAVLARIAARRQRLA